MIAKIYLSIKDKDTHAEEMLNAIKELQA
jgi:hypothetical protein